MKVSVRFEVLRRDGFACRYCGRNPPEVVLEVDHLLPLAGGGSDELDNLATACRECNAGKSNRLLETGECAPRPLAPTAAEQAERDERAWQMDVMVDGALHTWMAALWPEIDELYALVSPEDDGPHVDARIRSQCPVKFPATTTLRYFLSKLSPLDLMEAIDITAERCPRSADGPRLYFYKIVHNWIREGRQPTQWPSKPLSVSAS